MEWSSITCFLQSERNAFFVILMKYFLPDSFNFMYYECPHFAKLLVGAGFACLNASTYILVDVSGRANPAPTLDICGYSNYVYSLFKR